jgi:ketosteroid isomerase-like protein
VSEENVAKVRASYEAFRVDLLHPDIEWHLREDLPDSGVYRGHEGAAAVVSEWTAAFEDLRIDVEEQIDVGDRVISVVWLRGRMRDSGQTIEMQEVHVCRVKDGRIIEIREYRTKAEALGLEE